MNWKIREALRHIEDGGIIAYPTETVYGLGCDPFNAAAVLHLLDLKQRNIRQGLVLVASDFDQLQPLLLPLAPAVKKRVTKTVPGATTWVLPCLPDVPAWLRGKQGGDTRRGGGASLVPAPQWRDAAQHLTCTSPQGAPAQYHAIMSRRAARQ